MSETEMKRFSRSNVLKQFLQFCRPREVS